METGNNARVTALEFKNMQGKKIPYLIISVGEETHSMRVGEETLVKVGRMTGTFNREDNDPNQTKLFTENTKDANKVDKPDEIRQHGNGRGNNPKGRK